MASSRDLPDPGIEFVSPTSPALASGFYMYTSVLSHVQLFATPWTVALQAALSMGILPDPGIEPVSS